MGGQIIDSLINDLRVIQRALRNGLLHDADKDALEAVLATCSLDAFKVFYLQHRYKKLGVYGLTQTELQYICRLIGHKYTTCLTKAEATRHVANDPGSTAAIIENPPKSMVEICSVGRRDTSGYLEGKRLHERDG